MTKLQGVQSNPAGIGQMQFMRWVELMEGKMCIVKQGLGFEDH